MTILEMREEIVEVVSSFAKKYNLDYRQTWLNVYEAYEDKYHIAVMVEYKMGSFKSKFEYLYAYEPLYKTFTKLYDLIQELK
jgi:hypothetical protein